MELSVTIQFFGQNINLQVDICNLQVDICNLQVDICNLQVDICKGFFFLTPCFWLQIPMTDSHGNGIFTYIFLLIFMVNVGKYPSHMDPMGLGVCSQPPRDVFF